MPPNKGICMMCCDVVLCRQNEPLPWWRRLGTEPSVHPHKQDHGLCSQKQLWRLKYVSCFTEISTVLSCCYTVMYIAKNYGFLCLFLLISTLVQVLTKMNFWGILFMHATIVLVFFIITFQRNVIAPVVVGYSHSTMCWTSWDSAFHCQQGQEIFLFSKVTGPALGPAQPSSWGVLDGFLPKDKVVLAWS